LLAGLPDAILIAVIEGRLSSWAASRVVAPLARANSEHAERLVKALSDAPLATRELRQWFDHYQKPGRLTRERLVDHPPSASVPCCPGGKHRAGPERRLARRPGRQLRDTIMTHQCADPQRAQAIAESASIV
jgi:hypothetical protein